MPRDLWREARDRDVARKYKSRTREKKKRIKYDDKPRAELQGARVLCEVNAVFRMQKANCIVVELNGERINLPLSQLLAGEVNKLNPTRRVGKLSMPAWLADKHGFEVIE